MFLFVSSGLLIVYLKIQNYPPPPEFSKHGRITLRKASSNTWKTCPKERRVIRQMSKDSMNLEERILPTAVGFQAMTELVVQPYLYEPETNTECNANITVLFYEITERGESKFWSFKKTQNKRRHNEEGLMFWCVVLPGYKVRHDVLLMWKITACFHAVNTETVSMVWTCCFARKSTGLCMEY